MTVMRLRRFGGNESSIPVDRPLNWWGWMALILLAGVGCRGLQREREDLFVGKPYQPENVYRQAPRLPEDCRRIAVLPLVCDPAQPDALAARDLLEPILLEEIGKTRRFEVMVVSPDKLREWTGRPAWTAEEALPPGFLETLHKELACDAVLFVRVTQFQAYPPLAVGWRFRLADCKRAEAIWSVDEVFDAANPSVVNAARLYQLKFEAPASHLAVSGGILLSPRRFGRYSAAAVLLTLPTR